MSSQTTNQIFGGGGKGNGVMFKRTLNNLTVFFQYETKTKCPERVK